MLHDSYDPISQIQSELSQYSKVIVQLLDCFSSFNFSKIWELLAELRAGCIHFPLVQYEICKLALKLAAKPEERKSALAFAWTTLANVEEYKDEGYLMLSEQARAWGMTAASEQVLRLLVTEMEERGETNIDEEAAMRILTLCFSVGNTEKSPLYLVRAVLQTKCSEKFKSVLRQQWTVEDAEREMGKLWSFAQIRSEFSQLVNSL
jgi:hypothetical protein